MLFLVRHMASCGNVLTKVGKGMLFIFHVKAAYMVYCQLTKGKPGEK